MRKRPLMYMACVFLAGLAYQRYSCVPLMFIPLVGILREIWIGRKSKQFQKIAGRSLVLLSAFLLGIFHMAGEEKFRDAYMSKIEDGSRIAVWGELIKLESTDYGYRGILSNCYTRFGQETYACNDIMVYTSNDQYKVGQIYKVTGKVNMFPEAPNQGNFNSQQYYQSLKIDFAIDEEERELRKDGEGGFRRYLFFMREKIAEVYASCMEEKTAGFFQAMVLGDKKMLDEGTKELFLIGGITHILAISGLHVSILGRGTYRILRRARVGFGLAGMLGGVLLVLYCIMVGSGTSTIRAVVMMLLYFGAQWMGRSYDMLNALGAVLLCLLWDNVFLMENVGFWFSVTALLGVGYVGEILSRNKKSIKKSLWMSLGITLTTLPITAISYFEVPIYATLVNIVVLPLLTPVFVLAALGGAVGLFCSNYELLSILLTPCQWLLNIYEGICRLVEQLPGSVIICGKPFMWQVILYYVLLFGGIYLLSMYEEETKRKGRFQMLFIFLCVGIVFLPKPKEAELSFLDVGQGDGIYMCSKEGMTCFVDGGSQNVKSVGKNRILPFLKSKGIASIDYWFVSHWDSDHVSGLKEVLDSNYLINHLVVAEYGEMDEEVRHLLNAARERGVEIIYMEAGEGICTDGMDILCLGPIVRNGTAIGKDANEKSLVLQVEWEIKGEKKFRALLAGDISTEMENKLCELGLLEDVDLLKAIHHGSNYSNGALLLEKIRPECVVISCSKYNRYGHPGGQAIGRMKEMNARIFYTMENGQVTFPLIQ